MASSYSRRIMDALADMGSTDVTEYLLTNPPLADVLRLVVSLRQAREDVDAKLEALRQLRDAQRHGARPPTFH